jgi:Cu/Ag efflux pump CusA
VLHQQAQRVQTVTANVVGRDLTSFVNEVKAQIAQKVSLPMGTYVQFAGEAEAHGAIFSSTRPSL